MLMCRAFVRTGYLGMGWAPCMREPLPGKLFCPMHDETFTGVMLGVQNIAEPPNGKKNERCSSCTRHDRIAGVGKATAKRVRDTQTAQAKEVQLNNCATTIARHPGEDKRLTSGATPACPNR